MSQDANQARLFALPIALGAAVGAAIGAATGPMGVWVAAGVAIGAAIAMTARARTKKSDEWQTNSQEVPCKKNFTMRDR
jgi:hypothetical protein